MPSTVSCNHLKHTYRCNAGKNARRPPELRVIDRVIPSNTKSIALRMVYKYISTDEETLTLIGRARSIRRRESNAWSQYEYRNQVSDIPD